MPRVPVIHRVGPADRPLSAPSSPLGGVIDALGQVQVTLEARAKRERDEARTFNLSRALTEHTTGLGQLKIDAKKIANPEEREKFYADGMTRLRTQSVSWLDPDQVADFDFRTANTRAAHQVHFADDVTGLREERLGAQVEEIHVRGAESLDIAGGDPLLAEQVERDIAGQFQALGLEGAALEAEMAKVQRTGDIQAMNRLIDSDLGAALTVLRDPVKFYEMTDRLDANDRNKLQHVAETRQNKIRSESRRNAEWGLRLKLREAELSGDVDAINSVYGEINSGVLGKLVTPATGAKMMSRLDKARNKLIESTANEGVFELLYDRAAESGVPIDPKAMDDFDEYADKHYQQLLARAGDDDEAQFEATVQFVQTSGHIPNALKGNIERVSRSSDPEVAASGALMLERLTKALPQYSTDLADRETRGLLHDIAAATMLAGGGENAASAVEGARQRRVTDPIVREAREARLKAFVKEAGSDREAVVGALGELGRVSGGAWFGLRDAVIEPEAVPQEFVGAVLRQAQNYLYTSDDPAWALQEAVKDASKGWGPDLGFDGKVRLKPLAPAKFHPSYDRDAAAVEVTEAVNVVMAGLGQEPVEPSQVHLWPTVNASRRQRNGQHAPDYYVMVQREGDPDGGVPLVLPTGEPLTYEPPAPVAPVGVAGGFEANRAAKIALQYLAGEIDTAEGLDPRFTERLQRIRDLARGPGGPAQAMLEAVLTGDRTAWGAVRSLVESLEPDPIPFPTETEIEP